MSVLAETSSEPVERIGPVALQWAAWAASAYVIIVFVHGETIAGQSFGVRLSLVAFCVVAGLVAVGIRLSVVRAALPASKMLNLGLLMFGTLVGLILVDEIFGVYTNVQRARTASTNQSAHTDSRAWLPEGLPPTFAPSGDGFLLYKHDVVVDMKTYGWMYKTEMLSSRTLVDTVLDLRDRSYQIGPLGLRDLTPIGSARYFALGNSFVFGYGINEADTWPILLGNALGEHVYNLGIAGAGPAAEVALLKHMMAVHADSLHIQKLIWMMYEGNDLDDDSRSSPPVARTGLSAMLSGTALQVAVDLPNFVKNESVLRKLLYGDLILPFGLHRARYGIRTIDGVALETPLFRSKLGNKMFAERHINRAQLSRAEVMNHKNLPSIEQAFRDMRVLADRGGFTVTVVLAPSDVRLHGPAFEGFPKLEPPHFLNWLATQANDQGFQTVNLLPLMQPIADEELLYSRDDSHWNRRGNEVVAQLLKDAIH